MGGRAGNVLLPLVAIAAAGAMTGGFGLAAAPAAIGGKIAKTLAPAALLGSGIAGQMSRAESQKALLQTQIQAQEAEKLRQELNFEQQNLKAQKDLQRTGAQIGNSGVDSDTRSSLTEALNSDTQSQLAASSVQNALSMQRINAGIAQSRLRKAQINRDLGFGLFNTATNSLGRLAQDLASIDDPNSAQPTETR